MNLAPATVRQPPQFRQSSALSDLWLLLAIDPSQHYFSGMFLCLRGCLTSLNNQFSIECSWWSQTIADGRFLTQQQSFYICPISVSWVSFCFAMSESLQGVESRLQIAGCLNGFSLTVHCLYEPRAFCFSSKNLNSVAARQRLKSLFCPAEFQAHLINQAHQIKTWPQRLSLLIGTTM